MEQTVTRETVATQEAGCSYGSYIKRVLVTPAKAAAWLETQETNRKVLKSNVAKLVRQLREGKWRDSVDLIAFDIHGHLFNGQHRLHAIVETGISVWLDVKYNCPPETKLSTDNGTPRSAAATTTIWTGRRMSNQTAAAARIMANPLYLTSGGRLSVTADDLIAFCEGHWDVMDFLDARGYTHTRAITQAPVLAAIGNAYRTLGPEVCGRFLDLMQKPQLCGPGESAVSYLVFWLLESASSKRRGSLPRTWMYYTTEAALASFAKGEDWGQVRVRREGPARYSLTN